MRLEHAKTLDAFVEHALPLLRKPDNVASTCRLVSRCPHEAYVFCELKGTKARKRWMVSTLVANARVNDRARTKLPAGQLYVECVRDGSASEHDRDVPAIPANVSYAAIVIVASEDGHKEDVLSLRWRKSAGTMEVKQTTRQKTVRAIERMMCRV